MVRLLAVAFERWVVLTLGQASNVADVILAGCELGIHAEDDVAGAADTGYPSKKTRVADDGSAVELPSVDGTEKAAALNTRADNTLTVA